ADVSPLAHHGGAVVWSASAASPNLVAECSPFVLPHLGTLEVWLRDSVGTPVLPATVFVGLQYQVVWNCTGTPNGLALSAEFQSPQSSHPLLALPSQLSCPVDSEVAAPWTPPTGGGTSVRFLAREDPSSAVPGRLGVLDAQTEDFQV